MPLRPRVAIELAVLAVFTTLYLVLMPARHPWIDVGLALGGLGLVGLSARETRERIWGRPMPPRTQRLRRAMIEMTLVTVPALLFFGLYGAWERYSEHRDWGAVAARLFHPNLLLALTLYIPWALAQQTLFQFYLHGRLRLLLPLPPLLVSLANGLLFGAVHLPDRDVALLTAAGGVMWSYSYQETRIVYPIALSHALVGASYFYWVRDHDLLLKLFSTLQG